MPFTTYCKECGKEIVRRRRPGVFCSYRCKGDWQKKQVVPPFKKEWLHKKYIVEELSTYKIAKIVNCDPKTVYRWLKVWKIPTRKRGWRTNSNTMPYHNETWLRREYLEAKRSASEIASQFNRHENTILFFLDKFKIQRRSISEARAVKHWGLPGSQNGMYGKRGSEVPNWKGGCTPERQAFYSSTEWKCVSLAVWKRDRGACQRCTTKPKADTKLHIHHLVSFAEKDLRAKLSNLILLCVPCHRFVHSLRNINREFIKEEE